MKPADGTIKKSPKPVLGVIARCVLAFVLCLALLFGLLCLTSLIPVSAIREHIAASAVLMDTQEGDFYYRRPGDARTIIHDYADAVYLNLLLHIDGDGLLKEVIAAPLYADETGMTQTGSLRRSVEQDPAPNAMYDRYWHGMLLLLRPLLVVTDISGVRVCITVLLLGLLAALCVLLWLRGQRDLSVLLVLCAALIRFPMLGLCVEYSPTWLVGLGFAIAAVFLDKASEASLAVLFVLCGVCTAFFDFLTTETAALLLPLIVLLCLRQKEGRLRSFRDGLRLCALAGLAWLLSYAAAFAAKWLLAEAVLGGGRIADAVSQAVYRQGFRLELASDVPQPVLAVAANLQALVSSASSLNSGAVLSVFAGVLVLLGALVYLFRKTGEQPALSLLLYLLAFLPLLRFAVLNSHSMTHTFFTYRALFSTVLCLLLATWRITSFGQFRSSRPKRGKKK